MELRNRLERLEKEAEARGKDEQRIRYIEIRPTGVEIPQDVYGRVKAEADAKPPDSLGMRMLDFIFLARGTW